MESPPSRARLHRLTRALFVCCLLSVCASARGDAEPRHSAVLVVPSQLDATLREIVARLSGELAAAGFSVSQLRLTEALSPRLALERAAGDGAPTAVILVRNTTPHGASVDLWISDRVLGRTSNTRLSVPESQRDQARRLAVEAVEVLRARIAELLLGAPAASAQAPAATRSEEREVAAPTSRRVRLAVGGGARMLLRRQLWDRSTLPSLGAELWWERPGAQAFHPVWALTLRAAGYGQRVERQTELGSAEAQQGLALLGGSLRGASRFALEPELGFAAGVYGLGVRGRADPPYAAHAARSFSPLVSAALGLRARIGARDGLRLSADLLYALRKSSVRIVDRQVARSGGALFALNFELWVAPW